MKKLKIDNSQLTIIALLAFFLLSIFHFQLSISTVLAVDSTPSANIKEKLDSLKKEIASKAAALKQEVNQKLQNKAYVGVIKTKSNNSVTLAAKSGSKIINVNQDTLYQGTTNPSATPTTKKTPTPKKVTVTFELLKEEDFIVAMGDIDDTGVLTAKKLILLPTVNVEPKTHLWGEVISVSSDRLLTVKNRGGENKTVSVLGEASFKMGSQDASLADVKKGVYIITSGLLKKDGTLSAEYVYIIPQGTQTPKPTSTASASATPKTSAKPIASPKSASTPKPTPKSS